MCAKDTHNCYAIVVVTAEPEYQPADYVEFSKSFNDGNTTYEEKPWLTRVKPLLIADESTTLTLEDLGIKGQALQGGYKHLTAEQFIKALLRFTEDSADSAR